MSEFCNVAELTNEDYSKIFQAPGRDARRRAFLDALGIEGIDEESELRKSIVLDFCLDIITFSSNQGFSWENVHRALTFGLYLLDQTACQGKELNDALQIFKENIAEHSSTFTSVEMKALIDHFLSTIYRHYNLYLFCMTKEQEVNKTSYEINIEVPFIADQLSKGVDLEMWNYEQSIKKMEDEKECQEMERLNSLKNRIDQLDEEKRDALNDLENMHENENSEDLPSILERLTKLHVESVESEIQNSVEDSKGNVEFRMQKASLTKPDSAKLKPTSRQRPASQQRSKSRKKK